jgi:glycolate oxidase iron-sulfur subunit
MLPRIEGAPFDPRDADDPPAPTANFFSGCVMAGALGDVQRATVRVLERGGHRVATPAAQACCGALHQHAGLREEARELARANLDAFAGDAPICVNSAGCSLAMKGYAQLLPKDPRAAAFVGRVRDLSELVGGLARARPRRVAVQEACHHHNVQRLRGRAGAELARLGITVVSLPRGAGCCGSAGLWSATHPEPAWTLLQRLLDAVDESGCDVVVSSNPGCLMFLRAGLRARGSAVRALHLAELLDDG